MSTDTLTERPLADPHAVGTADGLHQLMHGRGVRHMGTGDSRPPVMRRGALDAHALPSRMGRRLVWRDGQGNITRTEAAE